MFTSSGSDVNGYMFDWCRLSGNGNNGIVSIITTDTKHYTLLSFYFLTIKVLLIMDSGDLFAKMCIWDSVIYKLESG